MTSKNDRESEFRRRWYAAHLERFERDSAAVARGQSRMRGVSASAAEALAIRDALVRTGDVEAFSAALRVWAVKPGTLDFNGFNGQMMVNQLMKRSTDNPKALADVLIRSLATPSSTEAAASQIQLMIDYVESIRVGMHPAAGRALFLLSYFWALDDHERWPVFWASAVNFMEYITGNGLPPELAERYVAYCDWVRALDGKPEQFESVAVWWDDTKPVFLDPVLVDRSAFGRHDDGIAREALAANAASLLSVAQHIGPQLVDELSAAAGRTLVAKKPPRTWADDRPRSDVWVDWWLSESWRLGLRLWVNDQGACIGIVPGQVRPGWLDEAADVVARFRIGEYRLIGARGSRRGEDHGLVGRSGEFVFARWFEPDQLSSLDVRAELRRAATALRPVLDALVQAATGEAPPETDDPLLPLVHEYLARGYPTPADEQHRADRQRFADLLAADAIGSVDPAELRKIWNTSRYASPGPQSVFNTSLRDADAGEYDRIIRSISYLCWGEDDDAVRIDRVLSDPSYAVRGLGEAVIIKLLSIAHPERYLPVFPYSGPMGKRRMLQLLGLPEPVSESRGAIQVQANDQLRSRLDRLFPGDPWGMGQFLYWYAERGDEPEAAPVVDPLDDVASKLLVDRSFLDDIVSLLQDKGQVILYGPPGTGKTYLARKLAEALVPDPTRRSLVQFHPSTSYEDFFEGYRPETSTDGTMTYRLTPGPLALLAARATEAPGKRHIMIIDEINRANLPRVLGELLFLFEYRDEQVRTLYRPDDAFELPKDLWFIGTMNTADRSIALVDAALRRRFHFVPFFPNHGPMQGLLDRWLAEWQEPAWIGELVAMVNDELTDALGGPHLQLGPSHFMRKGLDEDRLRLIWQYNIEPFIEDQFFGDGAQVERFRFETVLRRFRASAGYDETSGTPVGRLDDAPAGEISEP